MLAIADPLPLSMLMTDNRSTSRFGREARQACRSAGAVSPRRSRPARARPVRVVAMAERKELIEVAGRVVTVSNPDKVYFPRTGHTKLDLVRYYLSVADGALRGVADRPMVLKRFVNGAEGEAFFQKRAPASRPGWLGSVVLSFPSGRTAEEIVVTDAAGLAWVANLGCIDLNPHPIRADDLDHPDELRVDLDPVPGIEWPQIVSVALVGARSAGRFRADRLAEDLRVARDARVRAHRAPLGIHRRPARRGRAGPRDRAAGAGRGDVALVEGRAARRLRGLQPERQGPHRRLRLLGPAGARRPGVRAAALGRGGGLRSGGVHDRHGAAPVRRDRGSRRRASTRPPADWTGCWNSPPRTTRPGCRTRPGRRISRSSRASSPACSPARGARCRSPSPVPGRKCRRRRRGRSAGRPGAAGHPCR